VNQPGRLVLLGHPVSHSLSPAMQNAALEAAGIRLTYAALDVMPDELDATFEELAACRGAGNVTIPHKVSAMRAMKRLSQTALKVGAVNTFRTNESGALEGENTDVAGFQALVNRTLGGIPSAARVALLGTGGAAAAVLVAVEEWPRSKAIVYTRNPAKAAALRARFSDFARIERLTPDAMLSADLVVNATPVGMNDDEMPLPLESIPPTAVVLDLVTRSDETAWVRAARQSGRTAADGLAMLVEQGAAAFKFWLGIDPDREAMWRAVTAGPRRD
jgi:shikimate dehydrogenase